MQINPKFAIWLNVVAIILSAITTGALSFTGVVSQATATQIVAFSGIALGVVNLFLHSYSSTVPGPLAPPDPITAPKVATVK